MEREKGAIGSAWHTLLDVPIPLRHAFVGGAVAGVLGGIIGLVVGLRAYAPTAWFAIFEAGLPAAALGLALGLIVGWVKHLVSRRQGHLPSR